MATMPFSPCDASSTVAGTASTCADVSVNLLQSIFGPVINSLAMGTDPSQVSASTSLIGSLMGYFNSGILTVATMVLSYVAIMGVINTANDGEAMGRNWSSWHTIGRIITGASVLLPSASGYSYIQLIVMMIALWSVGFANSIFHIGVQNLLVTSPLTSTSSQVGLGAAATANPDYPLYNLREYGAKYLADAYCAKMVNSIYGSAVVSGSTVPNVAVNVGIPDQTSSIDGLKTTAMYQFKDRSASPLAGGEPVCGTYSLFTYATPAATTTTNANLIDSIFPSTALSTDAGNSNNASINTLSSAVQAAKTNAVYGLMSQIDGWVATWPSDINQDTWNTVQASTFNSFVTTAQNDMVTQLSGTFQSDKTLSNLMNAFTTSITKDGWIMAGGYYQRMSGLRSNFSKIYSESPGSVTLPALNWLPNDAAGDEARNSAAMTQVLLRKVVDGNESSPGATSKSITDTSNIESILPSNAKDFDIDLLANRSDTIMGSWTSSLMQSVTSHAIGGDGTVDPIGRIKTLGDTMAIAAASIVLMQKTFTILQTVHNRTGEGIAAQVLTVGHSAVLLTVVEELVIKPLSGLGKWLSVLSFYFGVFLPSLPYAIFVVAVVGWLLAVIQTVFSAPLWAVLHMTPDRSFVGSQSQGYLMLLSLFMRPALIIVGLFVGLLLANPVLMYVSKAFFAMQTANINSGGGIGWVAQIFQFFHWVVMYGLILLPIFYMIFGLSQNLPDAVLTWIGAGIKPLGETHAVDDMNARMQRYGMGLGVPRRLSNNNNNSKDDMFVDKLSNNKPSPDGGGGSAQGGIVTDSPGVGAYQTPDHVDNPESSGSSERQGFSTARTYAGRPSGMSTARGTGSSGTSSGTSVPASSTIVSSGGQGVSMSQDGGSAHTESLVVSHSSTQSVSGSSGSYSIVSASPGTFSDAGNLQSSEATKFTGIGGSADSSQAPIVSATPAQAPATAGSASVNQSPELPNISNSGGHRVDDKES